MTIRKFARIGAAIVLGGGGVLAVTPLGRDLLFHVLPVYWTGEAQRLSTVLGIGAGSAVADIGAGSGGLVVELSKIVGSSGRAFATERAPEQRSRIAERAASAGVAVTVLEGLDRATNLPDRCCDAVTMRMVMHHIADPGRFAVDLRRSLRPGGRVGIIDFAAGAMTHLGGDHGVSETAVSAAFSAAGFSMVSRDGEWGGRTYLIVFRAP